jgi:hypothetical protein
MGIPVHNRIIGTWYSYFALAEHNNKKRDK